MLIEWIKHQEFQDARIAFGSFWGSSRRSARFGLSGCILRGVSWVGDLQREVLSWGASIFPQKASQLFPTALSGELNGIVAQLPDDRQADHIRQTP
jgi:hypothetical protein